MASYPTKDSYGGYEDSRFEKDVDENFHCSICYNVLKEPRTCRNNEHMFCLACISQHLNENSETCPECNEHLSEDTLRRPRVVNNCLSKLKINCDYASRGCPDFTCLEELKTHVANCGFSPVLCSNEGCGMEFNKQERVHHETAVCEYRKVKCHDCGQIQVVVGSMMELNEKVDAVREEIKNIPVQDDDEIENHFNEMKQEVEVVKKEVKRVQDNAFKVNEDLAELKVMMSQVLEKLNNLEPFTLSAGGYMVPHYTRSRLWNPGPAPKIAIPGQDVLNPSVLAQASAADQKEMLGERLFPLIQQTHPDLAGKITGMLLEIDNAELLHMLEFHDALAAKVDEAVSVIQAHQERNAEK